MNTFMNSLKLIITLSSRYNTHRTDCHCYKDDMGTDIAFMQVHYKFLDKHNMSGKNP